MKLSALSAESGNCQQIYHHHRLKHVAECCVCCVCVCACACMHLKTLCKFCSILPCIINEQKFLVVSNILLELHINCAHTHTHSHTRRQCCCLRLCLLASCHYNHDYYCCNSNCALLCRTEGPHYTYATSDTLRGSSLYLSRVSVCVCVFVDLNVRVLHFYQ